MTTETPDPPQPPLMDVAEVYRTLGRLEEGQSQLKDQLVRHEERNERQFDRIEQRFDRMDERFARVDERFTRVDERFDRIEQRFTRIEGRIDRLMLALFAIGATIIVGFGGIILQNALGG
jgi:predicted nuclease with TOPRIM domain